MTLHNRKHLKLIRKELRNHATSAEARLWKYLQKRQLAGKKFRRQHSIGEYIVDFYCPEAQLVIEIDDGIHEDIIVKLRDLKKESFIVKHEIKLIRFTNEQIFNHLEAVLEEIKKYL